MKHLIITILMAWPLFAYGQKDEAAQLALNYQKLAQLKSILSNMKKGYDIVSKGYGAIKDISEGNFSLHDAFLSGLLAVSPAVKNYRRVADIIDCQRRIVKEYRTAYDRFRTDPHFQPAELSYMGKVYANLFNQSIHNLDELAMVVTAGKLRMSDDERLQAIDRIFADTEDKLSFLRDFNNSTKLLSLRRRTEAGQVERMQQVYGIVK